MGGMRGKNAFEWCGSGDVGGMRGKNAFEVCGSGDVGGMKANMPLNGAEVAVWMK
ncbi:hypothetical protein [Paenibacillus donghaensis]|uniref:hypothetical protein n=1 Tax=Paenibacillus donghaensis TaxID=414771 RepID=UPI0014712445|nr:hypothetical protein [Paenibacillus donghaensis]